MGQLSNVVKLGFKMSFGTFIKNGKYILLLKIKHQYHCSKYNKILIEI